MRTDKLASPDRCATCGERKGSGLHSRSDWPWPVRGGHEYIAPEAGPTPAPWKCPDNRHATAEECREAELDYAMRGPMAMNREQAEAHVAALKWTPAPPKVSEPKSFEEWAKENFGPGWGSAIHDLVNLDRASLVPLLRAAFDRVRIK